MKQKLDSYPFVPKSAAWLLPGHFWALPLSDGTNGCGRVIQIPNEKMRRNSVHFLAAVLDWHSKEKPTSENIAGVRCIKQGDVHMRAITTTGGEILGFRDLALDAIEPWHFRGAEFWRNSFMQHGFNPIRPQAPQDQDLPILSNLGFNVLRLIAEARFVKKEGRWANKALNSDTRFASAG